MQEKNKTPDKKSNELEKPDPETLHTTEPQEHMEEPISSIVQDVRKIKENKKKKNEKPSQV
jgi:hypothetical protein